MTSFEKIGWWVETPRYCQREWGEQYAVGRALISPERSKGKLDNYRFMRDVQKGDTCLHLNESKEIAGISRAIASHKPFPYPVDGASGICVPLSGYHPLEPTLNILTDEYAARLHQLREAAKKHKMFFFYTRDLRINMYLTPVPQVLLDLLDEAYIKVAGRTINDVPCSDG